MQWMVDFLFSQLAKKNCSSSQPIERPAVKVDGGARGGSILISLY
jgi:hypothetical protein